MAQKALKLVVGTIATIATAKKWVALKFAVEAKFMAL
jgi:hypothetical protein